MGLEEDWREEEKSQHEQEDQQEPQSDLQPDPFADRIIGPLPDNRDQELELEEIVRRAIEYARELQ